MDGSIRIREGLNSVPVAWLGNLQSEVPLDRGCGAQCGRTWRTRHTSMRFSETLALSATEASVKLLLQYVTANRPTHRTPKSA